MIEKTTAMAVRLKSPRASLDMASPAAPAHQVVIRDEAVRFCQSGGLQPSLQQCLTLVAVHFRVTSPITVSVQSDPEFPDEWLEVDITVEGDVDAVSTAYDAYTRDWLDAAPRDLSHRIRLSVGLA